MIAVITGITGQDGSYLAELLLAKGYEVHGLVRRTSTLQRPRLAHLYADDTAYGSRLHLHYADLLDGTSIRRILHRTAPDEIYHLAGQSHVGLSFEIPESTSELTATATLRLLEIIRDLPKPPRFLHASSREIFGCPATSPQDESTPMIPTSPYGCAKTFATHLTRIYRESFGLHASNAICFNHESPRRSEHFVSRKITLAAARISRGLQSRLELGDIDAARDWGYAPDFVHGMWLMLQQDKPDDYVLATGISHTVRDVLDIAFGVVDRNWRDFVHYDKRQARRVDPTMLVGDPSKARRQLDWQHTTSFRDMIVAMVNADCAFYDRPHRDTA